MKTLFLMVAVGWFALSAASCGTNHAKVRFVQASPNALSVDVAVDGKTVVTDLAFGGLAPATDYLTIEAGNRKVEVRPTGTTTDLINSTVAFASQKKYTMLAVGLVPPAKPTIAALLKTDDNSPPQSGNINLRVIHASTAGPPNLDIFVVAPGTNITNATPNISALAYQQASDYLNVPAATYEVIMADPTDRTIRPVDRTYTLTAGQIRTLVVVDLAGGSAISPMPLELSDLN